MAPAKGVGTKEKGHNAGRDDLKRADIRVAGLKTLITRLLYEYSYTLYGTLQCAVVTVAMVTCRTSHFSFSPLVSNGVSFPRCDEATSFAGPRRLNSLQLAQ